MFMSCALIVDLSIAFCTIPYLSNPPETTTYCLMPRFVMSIYVQLGPTPVIHHSNISHSSIVIMFHAYVVDALLLLIPTQRLITGIAGKGLQQGLLGDVQNIGAIRRQSIQRISALPDTDTAESFLANTVLGILDKIAKDIGVDIATAIVVVVETEGADVEARVVGTNV